MQRDQFSPLLDIMTEGEINFHVMLMGVEAMLRPGDPALNDLHHAHEIVSHARDQIIQAVARRRGNVPSPTTSASTGQQQQQRPQGRPQENDQGKKSPDQAGGLDFLAGNVQGQGDDKQPSPEIGQLASIEGGLNVGGGGGGSGGGAGGASRTNLDGSPDLRTVKGFDRRMGERPTEAVGAGR